MIDRIVISEDHKKALVVHEDGYTYTLYSAEGRIVFLLDWWFSPITESSHIEEVA